MIVLREMRRRAKVLVAPVFGLALTGYFAYHLVEGDRGLRAWLRITQELRVAKENLSGIAAERASQEAGTDADANAIREAVPDIVPVLGAGEPGGNGAASVGARGKRSWRGTGGKGGVAGGIRDRSH